MKVRIPRLATTVERRLLINYRVDATVAQGLLPNGLRPQLVDGSAVAGICMIRLNHLRPTWFRPRIGWGGENGTHRIAVEWDETDPDGSTVTRTGVYIPMRHSSSILPVIAGGRVFPGQHRRARFDVEETADHFRVGMAARNYRVRADVRLSERFSSGMFADDLDAASTFFRKDAVGWSPARDGSLEGLRLDTDAWQVHAATAVTVESSLFDAMPPGAAELDCVLVMRDVPITWSTPRQLVAPVIAPP